VSTPLTPAQTSEVVYAFLRVGTPPTAIANALGMDVEHVAAARSQMFTERYGTDEKAELADLLIFEAFEEAMYQVRHGTPTSKLKYCQMILARSIGIAGKSSPEMGAKVRDMIAGFAKEAKPPIQLEQSIYDA
jgi:hypothetical protein